MSTSLTKPVKVAINGFGRIGRRVYREALNLSDIQVVAINDLSKPQTALHLLKYDSVHGTLSTPAALKDNYLQAGKQTTLLLAEKDPSLLPWAKLGVDIVMECTGIFTDKEKAQAHINAGAKKVIISAPSKDADITICMGINENKFDTRQHTIISNASCTTNCLAPVVKVLDEAFGIVHGLMVTVHSYTNDQNVLDLPHKDLRRARAAALSQIPTTTGAAKAIGLVLPHLKGKLDGYSVRVPTPNVSMVDFTVQLKKPATKDQINEAMLTASKTTLNGILAYNEEELVSIDFNGNTNSSIFDSTITAVMQADGTAGALAKVVSWYDNESGFSARMIDLARFVAKSSN